MRPLTMPTDNDDDGFPSGDDEPFGDGYHEDDYQFDNAVDTGVFTQDSHDHRTVHSLSVTVLEASKQVLANTPSISLSAQAGLQHLALNTGGATREYLTTRVQDPSLAHSSTVVHELNKEIDSPTGTWHDSDSTVSSSAPVSSSSTLSQTITPTIMSGDPVDNNGGDIGKGGPATKKSTDGTQASAPSAPIVALSASSTTGRLTTSGSGAPSGGDDDPRRGNDDNGPGDGNSPPPGPGPGPRHISRSPSVVLIPARLPNVQDRPSVMKARGGGYPQQPPLPDGSPNILDTWERSALNVNAQSRSSITEPLHAQFMELVTEVFAILMVHNHASYTSNIHQYVETIATSVNGMPDIPVRPGQAQYSPSDDVPLHSSTAVSATKEAGRQAHQPSE